MINSKYLISCYERALKFPALLPSELLNIDRYLDRKDINFSAKQTNFDVESFTTDNSGLKYTKRHVLKEIESIASHKKRMIQFFNNSSGVELNVNNILIANYLKNIFADQELYLYFTNRYLANFNYQGLTLNELRNRNIFNRFSWVNSFQQSEFTELVSVIMPAFNNADTVEYAAKSILMQSHKNIELIIIDDKSTDRTYKICQDIASKDSRVKVLRNTKNSGAYVSRNRGIQVASGDYITILDADDWSFPYRIAHQLRTINNVKGCKVHLGYYLRMNDKGFFTGFRIKGKFSYDGILHKCLASIMIERKFLTEKLGYWDSVRFGADSEMYSRIKVIDEACIQEEVVPLMLALDRDDSLTKRPESALGNSLRMNYAASFTKYHQAIGKDIPRMLFPLKTRSFDAHKDMVVDL